MNCTAKNIFPKMPQEVFDLWIAPHLGAYGWPFFSCHDSVVGTRWQGFFAHRTLEQWAAFDWVRSSFIPSRRVLFPDTNWRIEGIVDHCAYGMQSEMANLHDTKQRFLACAAFIREHGRFPSPLVGVSRPDGIELVDGHHRMAALFYLDGPMDTPIPAWLASQDEV